MCQISINIPKAVLFDTRMNKEETEEFARKAVALGYYTQCGVSIGYCSQIAGMSQEDFVKYLGANQVSIFRFDDVAEFMEELDHA